jgi:hypothetical protein
MALAAAYKFNNKYVEKASNNVSLPPNTSKGEICLQICENGLNNVSLPPKVLLKGETCLQICGSSSIRVISHPFLPPTCPSHLLEEGIQP